MYSHHGKTRFNFNPQPAAAPVSVLPPVVSHELVHLLHRNHGDGSGMFHA
ncbi:YgjP-like metallopeptidase domain-containing protein [Anabaena azotica]|uniref:DUF45 domain-containing protein n=1 Tax=Anabaena azotica FACHB-119 TaxID=947527 RepID=A0ABR8DCI1_9NOST|nr:DUF45 domain-containing protein [Anabaena azotica FACHB-119]